MQCSAVVLRVRQKCNVVLFKTEQDRVWIGAWTVDQSASACCAMSSAIDSHVRQRRERMQVHLIANQVVAPSMSACDIANWHRDTHYAFLCHSRLIYWQLATCVRYQHDRMPTSTVWWVSAIMTCSTRYYCIIAFKLYGHCLCLGMPASTVHDVFLDSNPILRLLW